MIQEGEKILIPGVFRDHGKKEGVKGYNTSIKAEGKYTKIFHDPGEKDLINTMINGLD